MNLNVAAVNSSGSRPRQLVTPDTLLVLLLALLATGWWAMPFGSREVRVGSWITSSGLGSGPWAELSYDFLLFWHFGLACLVYLWIARKPVPAAGHRLVWWYPILSPAVMWISPWSGDSEAHRVFALMIYPATFYPLLILATNPPAAAHHSFALFSTGVICSGVALVVPVTGGPYSVLLLLVLSLVLNLLGGGSASIPSRVEITGIRGRDPS